MKQYTIKRLSFFATIIIFLLFSSCSGTAKQGFKKFNNRADNVMVEVEKLDENLIVSN